MDFVLLIAISIIVKFVLDAFKKMIPALQKIDDKVKQVAIFYILGFVLSLLLAVGMNAELFSMLGIDFGIKYVGVVVTALIASLGSKGVHDFINEYTTNTQDND